MYRRGISAGIALTIYMIVPDILDRGETVCFLLAVWMLVDLTLIALCDKALEIRRKRAELSVMGNRVDLGNRKSLPVNVKVRRAWPIILPAEKVEE